ncbi:hypothetical protein [Schlesneria sp. DSM 10557]|uniref:hypothetical protein n=1 Tax=Schlesneria sp. DSM 10557 TaxID=3044399 RepID=UPI0035A0D1A0
MVDPSRRDRVGLGLLGLGPSWELLYRPAIERLQKRLTIRLTYDTVEARARSVAADFEAEPVGSLHQMLNRPMLQGLLILDPGWLGAGALDSIARSGKPVYLASPILRRAAELHRLLREQSPSSDSGRYAVIPDDRWMPELRLRFTPASCRLRELIATRLGPVKEIQVGCNLDSDPLEIAHIVDWCADLMGQTQVVTQASDGSESIRFEFAPSGNSPRHRTARLRQSSGGLTCEVTCVRGRAVLRDRTYIRWEAAEQAAEEHLHDERSEIEILIDQFCRRAVGGLNPVGRLEEFSRAMRIVESLPHRR